MGKFLTQQEFLSQALAKHKDKYDFSKATYIHSKQKLTVFCNRHKKYFFISPNHLLKGIGCPDCGGTKKLTRDEFITQAKQLHGDRYDYSKVIYKNFETKVEIICRLHGSFFQRPHNHLDNSGCSICGGSNPLNTKEFIERGKAIHGGKYDYSKTVYSNTKTKVEIICKEHGSFWQTAGGHLSGYKCKKCSGNNSPSTLEFIDKANKIHNYFYHYDKTEYISAHRPVTISCKFHGDFQQTPNSHLKGHKCYLCSILNKKKSTLQKKRSPYNLSISKSLTEDFIKYAELKHGKNKYDYSKVTYLYIAT